MEDAVGPGSTLGLTWNPSPGRRVRKPARPSLYLYMTRLSAVHLVAEEAGAETTRANFGEMCQPHLGRLFGLARTILIDPAESEDAVQDALLSAWRRRSTLRDPEKFGAWLTRICVNECIRHRRWMRGIRLPWSDIYVDKYATPEANGVGFHDFRRAYKKLSRRQRAVFALHVEHGYSVNECADLLGCRPGTARSHLGRAVARLRKEMGDDNE